MSVVWAQGAPSSGQPLPCMAGPSCQQPFYWKGHVALPTGKVVATDWKCWRLQSGLVAWELAGPIYDISKSTAKVCRQLKEESAHIEFACQVLGAPKDSHVWPSRKAASAHARSLGRDACEAVSAGPFQQEWSISTLGLLQLLLVWALNKKTLASRILAKCVMTSWLAVFIEPLAAALHAACQGCQAAASHLCQLGRDADGLCMHMRGILADACASGPDLDAVQLTELLCKLFSISQSCTSTVAWYRQLMSTLSATIDTNVHGGRLDVTADITRHRIGPSGRKRRLDEDACLQTALGLNHSHPCSSAAGRHNGVATSTASSFDRRGLVAYMLAAPGHFEGVRHLCITTDGSRVGQPAEETNVYAAWSPDCSRSAWLAPQVPQA
jgi:hypothetical protein